MSKKVSFEKVDGRYVSDIITSPGGLMFQLMFADKGARVRVEKTLSADCGWLTEFIKVAPEINEPIEVPSEALKGSLVRLVCSTMPTAAYYIGAVKGNAGSSEEEQEAVQELKQSVEEIKTDLVENRRLDEEQQEQIDANKAINDTQQSAIENVVTADQIAADWK